MKTWHRHFIWDAVPLLYPCRNCVQYAVSRYNFSKITCVAVSYPYLYRVRIRAILVYMRIIKLKLITDKFHSLFRFDSQQTIGGLVFCLIWYSLLWVLVSEYCRARAHLGNQILHHLWCHLSTWHHGYLHLGKSSLTFLI